METRSQGVSGKLSKLVQSGPDSHTSKSTFDPTCTKICSNARVAAGISVLCFCIILSAHYTQLGSPYLYADGFHTELFKNENRSQSSYLLVTPSQTSDVEINIGNGTDLFQNNQTYQEASGNGTDVFQNNKTSQEASSSLDSRATSSNGTNLTQILQTSSTDVSHKASASGRNQDPESGFHPSNSTESKRKITGRRSTAFFTRFRATEKYLYYPRNGDWCAGFSHSSWSLSCALGEAIYLNRTFVFDMEKCVPGVHNEGKEVANDIRLYFDVERIKRHAKLIPRETFLMGWRLHNKMYPFRKISIKYVPWRSPSPPLVKETATIIQRVAKDYSRTYGFEVCHVRQNWVIKRPWGAVWGLSPPLMEVAWAISAKLHWDYDAIHVRRGDKLDAARWPHLDRDTRPPRILEVLRKKHVQPGRRVYIATNEYAKGFFDALKPHYKISVLSDFSALWAPGSKWWRHCRDILPKASNKSLTFDGVMKGMVDNAVYGGAKTKIETFSDLTSDPKGGVQQ